MASSNRWRDSRRKNLGQSQGRGRRHRAALV